MTGTDGQRDKGTEGVSAEERGALDAHDGLVPDLLAGTDVKHPQLRHAHPPSTNCAATESENT